MASSSVILANGKFPEADLPLGYLDSAEKIICCDGSVANLIKYGREPFAIVGDLDSLNEDLKVKFKDRIYHSDDPDTNDLTKAVKFCLENSVTDIVILGATGLRDDHTIGNISLLLEYSEFLSVRMISDFGIFFCVQSDSKVKSYPGQQVSVFSNNPELAISSTGLKYSLDNLKMRNWWTGTLNECLEDSFSLSFAAERVLVFLKF